MDLHKRYYFIRGSLGVRGVADKLQDSHLRRYGHIAADHKTKSVIDVSTS